MLENTETPKTILSVCLDEFRKMKRMAEGAIAQVEDAQLNTQLNPQQNSIATIVQHMQGNMLSRWTDFLTTDGEKPTRNREAEFATPNWTRPQMMQAWDHGWNALFAALAPLSDADLGRIVKIRNEPHTVFEAINRQTAHYALHVGQIVLIAKHLKGEGWRYLTIAPGGSAAFNKAKGL